MRGSVLAEPEVRPEDLITPPLRPAQPTTSPPPLPTPSSASGESPLGARLRAREAEQRAEAPDAGDDDPSILAHPPDRMVCWNCGQPGHMMSDCPQPRRKGGGGKGRGRGGR